MSQLSGQTALTGAPAAVGAYTVLASFPGSTDYSSATALADFSIAPATPTVSVNDPGGTYSGTAFVATAKRGGRERPGRVHPGRVAPSLTYYVGTYTTRPSSRA